MDMYSIITLEILLGLSSTYFTRKEYKFHIPGLFGTFEFKELKVYTLPHASRGGPLILLVLLLDLGGFSLSSSSFSCCQLSF